MFNNKNRLRTFLSALLLSPLAFSFAAEAKMMSLNAKDLYVVQDGQIELYGNLLNPHEVKADAVEYKWNQLYKFVPELLPEAKSKSMSADSMCDHIVRLQELYSMEAEKSEEFLADKIAKFNSNRNPFDEDENLVFSVSDRLTSPSVEKISEIMKYLPGHEEQIMVAQDIARKSLVMSYLHDAALDSCSAYAKKKGYFPILSYAGEDAGYNADKDPAWAEFNKKIKEEQKEQ